MIIAIILFALILLYVVLSFVVYRLAFHSPNRKQNDDFHTSLSPKMAAMQDKINQMIASTLTIPYQKVSITSRDGLTLRGRYYPAGTPVAAYNDGNLNEPAAENADGLSSESASNQPAWRENGLVCPFDQKTAPLAILCHGWRGTPARDFSGGARLMIRAGFQVLAIEQRAHVSSEGHTITFGVKERLDVLDWVRFATEELHAKKVILVGISMGAATVLMDAADVPSEVVTILADCPYTTPMGILQNAGRAMHSPAWLTNLLSCTASRVFGGFNIADKTADALTAVKNTKVPILIIHGEADDFVPCAMSREIRNANPDMVTLETFPGAGHGLSFLIDPARYKKVTLSFIENVLNP